MRQSFVAIYHHLRDTDVTPAHICIPIENRDKG
jgi:hypothetical protein